MRFLLLIACLVLLGQRLPGQAALSPRMTGLGFSGATVTDSRGFVLNPAGLTGMRDWEFSVATYLHPAGSPGGFVFDGVTVGKRFSERHAIGVQYTPGAALDFVVPATLSVIGLNIPTDRIFSYSEPFAGGYALQVSDRLAAGVAGRMRLEKVDDPQYDFQIRDTSIVPVARAFHATSWFVDAGVLWSPVRNLTLSAVAHGLLAFRKNGFPEEFRRYNLPLPQRLSVAVAWEAAPALQVTGGASTDGTGLTGFEWSPGGRFALRGSLLMSRDEAPFTRAVTAGLSWSYDMIDLDAGYLYFLNQDVRTGRAAASDFTPETIDNVSVNRFTRNQLSLGVKMNLGSVRTQLVKIEAVSITGSIYPAAYESFAYRPLGSVTIRNTSERPVEARAGFFIDQLMDAPSESGPVYIRPGDTASVPLTALFNDRIRAVASTTVREGSVFVNATPAEEYDDRQQTRILIYNKNAWDGDVHSLRFFVKPDDPHVLRYTRDILLEKRQAIDSVARGLEVFQQAKLLFDAFAGKLSYVNDPRLSSDYVQYPDETLSLRGGDCDDMTVCFASLLSSIGIATAFVDVVPPGHPEQSHIYLLFDTGLRPDAGSSISVNPKRYLVRRNKEGVETVWIPVETTVIMRGFDEAWTVGAQEYFDDVEVGLGLIKGWVRLVDVH